MSIEDTESPGFGTSSQVENTVKCCPIQVIPVPIPVVGMNSNIGVRYRSGMRLIFYPEPSAHHFGSAFYREGQRDIFKSSSCQSDTKDLYVNAGFRDEVCHVASVTGDSVNSSSCHDSASQTESNGLERISHENNANRMMINNFTAELQKQEENKSAELHSLNHREAALNKF